MQLYAEHVTQTATDKADTTQEGQVTEDKAAYVQVDLPADHPQEAHHTIDAQEDTEAPHHITWTPLPLQDPMQHQTVTQKTNQYN